MSKAPYHKDFKLGVLGGGQLGRMMQQEAVNLDIKLSCIDPNPNAPCAHLVPEFVVGDFNDEETVYNFGKDKDLITVEIEHVSIPALKRLQSEGVHVYPQPELLEIVQDKGLQKEFYKDKGIPTAEFRLIQSKEDLKDHVDFLPFAQKLRKGGYDGKGVQIMRTEADFEKAFDAPSVLEKFVPFEKELAVIAARNTKGETTEFPAVELEFDPEANLVELLFAPAEISAEIERIARNIAKQTIESFGFVGILAVELFVNPNGDVFVNEVAPRPHNSGHHTIEANITSQYAQHLRCILGLPLGDTALSTPAAMVNLLGEVGFSGPVKYEGLEDALAESGVYIHLYGKTDTHPFRKMGHVTITTNEADSARRLAHQIKDTIKVKSE
ncbi:MAG: 5-(carboxyamino)imidazole ribonucleotide synthase [Flavobacteriales bacterium]|nr:5-(carboxyamino)imidazole ribonucleotide synthase [Flavobacteriales bacterium]